MSKFTIDLDEDEEITPVAKPVKAAKATPKPPAPEVPVEVATRFRTDAAPVSRAFSPPITDADLIDIERVKDELVRVESAYRDASAEHAEAKIAEIRADVNLTQTKLQVDRERRAYYAQPDVKKPNEDAIKNEVLLHADVEQSAGKLRDCTVALLIAKHKLDVIANRQRVVIMLSALTRQEIAAFSN